MDPLDFLESEDLLRFFRCKKTELSCLEKPQTFMRQLRDHHLIPEDSYQKLNRMRSPEKLKRVLYEALDWLERKRSHHIRLFWSCVFTENMRNQYGTLGLLHRSLLDGSYKDFSFLADGLEEEEVMKETDRSEDDDDDDNDDTSAPKKKKPRRRSARDEDEQPGPSSRSSPARRTTHKKIHYTSPLRKGNRDLWTWPLYQSQLPVTCGRQEGVLNRDRLAKGERCISVGKRWFTPSEFERLGGRESSRNWKLSIRCEKTPLGKLLQEGHLTCGCYGRRRGKDRTSQVPSGASVTVSDEEEEGREQDEGLSTSERRPEVDSSQPVLEVTCGPAAAKLHKKRFASGTRGKCIRTETCWLSPLEFVRETLSQTDPAWKKEIQWNGKPLSDLIEADVLRIHWLLCVCDLCQPDAKGLESQKNDDECSVCRKEEEELVVCDHCPRSFHQTCHLPPVDESILGDDRPWMCTFCVFTQFRQWRHTDLVEREALMSHQLSQHMLECQYLLLHLSSVDDIQVLLTAPGPSPEDDETVDPTPVSLGNMAAKLQTDQYRTVGEFVSDVQLIFNTCASNNRENAEFVTVGRRLEEFFDTEVNHVFNIG